MKKRLEKGTRIRLKVRTICGWKGKATVVNDYGLGTVQFVKDDFPNELNCYCRRDEVAVLRAL